MFRAVTPPFIWDAAHSVKVWLDPPPPPAPPPPPPPPPVWTVDFPSWEAAKSAANTYSSDELMRFRLARFKECRVVGSLPLVQGQPLYWLTKLLGENQRITDFGGGGGEYGLSYLSEFPGAAYTVVELPPIVEALNGGKVQFSERIPTSCDVFYCNSAMQYLDDPYSVLEEGLASAARAVVLTRNCLSDEPVYRVQQSRLFDNGSGPIPYGFQNVPITYPVRSLQERRIDTAAKVAGFTLLARTAEPAALRDGNTYSVQLIYVRRQ